MKMNKVKKALIGTSLAGSLVVGAGYGTYSWFTAQMTASGMVQNGTFEINNGQSEQQLTFSPDKLAPSQISEMSPILIKNTGDYDMFIRGKVNFMIDNAPTEVSIKKLLSNYEVQPTILYNGETISDLDWIDLDDLQTTLDNLLPGQGEDDSDRFKANDKIEIDLKLRLKDSADNNLQGVALKVSFKVQAKQTDPNAEFSKK
ncbi:TasA family protein [Gottfriedia sp. NPDC057948]|uniref:TasA family protein n=1 Tax=Gottfriedia sp. NPDC057948 TaxID=3346287 RepID=UPI0036DB05B4